jgi:UDP-glucuronate 4-epimerase
MTQQRALVTGGAGFIGSHLVDRLLAEGWRVTVADNFDPFYARRIKEGNLAAHSGNPSLELYEIDIRDISSLERLTGNFDVVLHLAAKAGVRPSIEDPVAYTQVNVEGTQNMLEWAKARGIRQFVFASSSSVYGVNPKVPWREDDPVLLPISPYASTKASCELLGHVYSHLYGMRFLALRFFTVFGPRQRPDLAICKFADLILKGKPIPIYGDGTTVRSYTYVGDIVDGVRAAMDYTTSDYEIINLGTDRSVRLMEVVTGLEKVLGKPAILEYLPMQAGDVPQTLADISKAHGLLSYSPGTDFLSGLAKYTEWLQKTDSQSLSRVGT